MRRSLMEEFAGRQELVEGLCDASKAIVRSMLRCASDTEERAEAEAYARDFSIDPAIVPAASPEAAPKRGLVSRAVRLVSRFIPRPRP